MHRVCVCVRTAFITRPLCLWVARCRAASERVRRRERSLRQLPTTGAVRYALSWCLRWLNASRFCDREALEYKDDHVIALASLGCALHKQVPQLIDAVIMMPTLCPSSTPSRVSLALPASPCLLPSHCRSALSLGRSATPVSRVRLSLPCHRVLNPRSVCGTSTRR